MKKIHQVIVVGGGWAGVSAALAARKQGADVAICEKSDMLLGAGLVGGIMRNNGRFTAAEEAISMGFGEIFDVIDSAARHRNIEFPGHRHATLYDVNKIEPSIRKLVAEAGVKVYFGTRVSGIASKDKKTQFLISDLGDTFHAETFVDATGSSGPPGMCIKYGNGCVSCVQRCQAFGPRVSIATLAGVPEFPCIRRKSLLGAMSGSLKVFKDSLSLDLRNQLESRGVVVLDLPTSLVNDKKLAEKVCQQYALPEYAEKLVVLDTGEAKVMTPYLPLDDLRKLPGFENARYADPLAGGKGNSIRLTSVAPRDETMKVQGAENLFVAGEKAGTCVGHTEAIVTGAVAGLNAARHALGRALRRLPPQTAIGDYIAQSAIDVNGQPRLSESPGLSVSWTFAGSVYFGRMKALDLYSQDPAEIRRRIVSLGLESFFACDS